jgi:hypothetical protein
MHDVFLTYVRAIINQAHTLFVSHVLLSQLAQRARAASLPVCTGMEWLCTWVSGQAMPVSSRRTRTIELARQWKCSPSSPVISIHAGLLT